MGLFAPEDVLSHDDLKKKLFSPQEKSYYYGIVKGDNIESIANKFSIKKQQLLSDNNIQEEEFVEGRTLKINVDESLLSLRIFKIESEERELPFYVEKKENKNELKTWFFGSVLMFIISLLVGIIQVGNIIQNGFSVGSLILAIIFLGLALLFAMFIIRIIQAYRTYDVRKLEREQKEREEKEKEEEMLRLKHEQEKNEMEEIRRREAEKQRINMEELAKTKEAKEEEEE